MRSPIIKRSIVIGGHKTSVSLEDAFWQSLKEIGKARQSTLSSLVAEIDVGRQYGNLSSAIRLFVLHHFRAPSMAVATHHSATGPEPPKIRQGDMRALERVQEKACPRT